MRGINVAHAWYKNDTKASLQAISDLGANTVRVVLADGEQWSETSEAEIKAIIDQCRQLNMICVVEVHDHTGHMESACIDRTVNFWLKHKDLLNANKDYVIVNIANEWMGGWNEGDSATWENTYKSAVSKLRSQGLENVIMIDASGYGQNMRIIQERGKNVLAADPTGQTMFSGHIYYDSGKDANTAKQNIDYLLNSGLCTIIGEFGHVHEYRPVDYKTIMEYAESKGLGTLAWSWKGNGGSDTPLDLSNDFAGKDLTDWGKFVFNSTNGIKNTSVKPYNGGQVTPGPSVNPTDVPAPTFTTPPPAPTVSPDIVDVDIDPGLLGTLPDWYVAENGASEPSTVSTIEALENGGYRIGFDMVKEDYPTICSVGTPLDLTGKKKISLVVKNNNRQTVQLIPIFKVGDEYEWTEFANYKEIKPMTATQIDFDLDRASAALGDINGVLFRVQGAGSKVAGTFDFYTIEADMPTGKYAKEIAELNRPKSASRFVWENAPCTEWVPQTVSAKMTEDNDLVVNVSGASAEKPGGIQSEVNAGQNGGLDLSGYKSITATITNTGNAPMNVVLVYKTGGGWQWQENTGNGGKELELAPGETTKVTYDLTASDWKNAKADWTYTGTLAEQDDVRALGFKVYPSDGSGEGSVKISDFEYHL